MSIIDNSSPLTLNPSQNTQMINTINTNTQSFVNCNMLSNSVYITSNTLNTKINTKQDILTAGTTLLGVGSAISALDWNKITLNKPTIYTQTETNNLLNAKEAILTFSSPLTRTTNTIGINLSSYSTTGNDTSYLLKTGGTMTGALLNTSTTASEFKGIYILHSTGRQSHLPYLPNEQFYFRASVNIDNVNDYLSMGSRLGDNIIRLFSNDYGFGINSFTLRYNAPAGAFHRFYHGTTNTCWINDAGRLKATTFEGSGSALTNIPYSALTGTPTIYTQTETNNLLNAKEAILTFSSPLTRTTNTIGINLSSYSTTGNDTSYLLKTGGTMTGALNGTTINASTALQEAGINLTSKYLQLSGGSLSANANITLSGTGTFTGIHSGNGSALTNLPLSAYSTTGNDSSYVLKSGSTMTGTLNGTTIYTTGNVGVGTNNNIASLVVGNIDADGSDGSIAFSKRQNSGTKRNFKMGMNGDYTFCIGDYGSGNTTANSWSSNHFNIRYADGNVGIGIQGSGSYKLYVDGTTYFNGNSSINGTCSATTFSGSGANLTNLPLSAYSTTGNDSSYLLKTGGVMSGQITGITTLNSTTGIFGTISTTNTTNLNTPQLGAFGGIGDRIILYVGTASVHPYSLGMNSSVLWYSVPAGTSHIFYVGGSPITTISSTGLSTTGIINASTNLQEAGTNLTSKYLQLSGGTLTGNLTMSADFRAANIQVGGTAYQLLITPHTATKTYTEIQTIQQGIGYNQKLALQPISGNVGIGLTNPNATYKLDINGNLNATLIYEGGTLLTSKYLQLSGGNMTGNLGLNVASPETKIDVNGSILLRTAVATSGGTGGIFFRNGYATTGVYNCSILTYDHNADTFCDGISINGYDGVSICTGANTRQERMRVDVNGNVNIVNKLQIASVDINNWLFNNTGRNHGVYQDFNAIDKFGYSFIQNSTNGPGGDSQFYSWYIGLGNEYPFANSVNGYYGMQFAVGRFETYPKLSIRRKQANAWTGWEGLTAERAVSLTSGNKTIDGELTANQSFLGGLRINGGDGNTLYNYGRDLGLLVNSGQSINFNMWGGNGNIMTVNNSGVVIDVDGVPINITNKGIVIGTFTNQYYPFVVSRTINGTLPSVYVRTGYYGGSDYNSASETGNTSAAFQGQIYVGGNILNSSDIRIKREINDINDDGALQQILAIQPKTYKYVDYLVKGNSNVYGFIAQQVKEVIPRAVELVKDIIPNIYKRAICDSNIITLENDVSQELNINDNIKIYDEFGNDNMYNILEINENVIKIDKDINTSNIFVFGKEVDDFHTLKKDYIFTLNVCATQELYKLIQKQNEIIEELKGRISALEAINH
jgi:hypothetical protein